MSKKPDSFLGWLGRQVGFVGKAIKTDVTKPQKPKEPDVLYRAGSVEEVQHPQEPNVTLRRTTIDEVIVKNDEPQMNTDERG
jgi:hypothetical protein